MRALILLALLGACIDPVDARWQLDHDHVVAVRATPPRIQPGETAAIDGLVAHAGADAAVEIPAQAGILDGPEVLRSALWNDGSAWYVTAPEQPSLDQARAELGLAAGAPVPLGVYALFDGSMYAKKTVWLGASGANPAEPAATIDGAPMTTDVVVPMKTDVYLSVAVPSDARVSWLSSCGQLFQDDVATSFIRVTPDDTTAGQLAVVVRDSAGGVAWRVWPIHAD